MMTHTIRPRRSRQRGMTLIEFMVGMTIGLLVVLAAVSSLIMTRGSARTLSDSAGLEQQATLVMMQIGQQVTQTGAVTATSTAAGTLPYIAFNTAALGGVNTSNPTVSVFGSTDTQTDDAGYNADRVSVSYTAPTSGGPALNCIGNAPIAVGTGSAQRIVSQFYLSSASLFCTNGATGTAPQPIAGNVADMQVRYVQIDGTTGAVTYTSTATGPAPNWSQVVGVQICLEFKGDPTEAPPQTSFKDCRGGSGRSISDGRVHRIVKQTYYLRNTN